MLDFQAPHELLIAARLSAQCTDVRVNAITPELFGSFRTVSDFANADITEIESIVKPCGLFHTKAADIKNMCIMLLERFSGEVPSELDSLLLLPGVGRKTANLIVGELYKKPAIVTDTHVIRLSNRLGLVSSENPKKIEQTLREIIPESESMAFCHRLVLHGREVCRARNPKCDKCVLKKLCEK